MVDVSQADAAAAPADGGLAGPHTALEDLLAVVAHEMRAPLAVVCSAADAVATGNLAADRQQELLQVIRRNAELAMLLTDRLRLARDVEEGVFDLERTELDLSELTAETVADLGTLVAEGRRVRLVAATPVRVIADPTSLREILFNLLLNAAKYSDAGTDIDVSVTTDGAHATLAVRDAGVGIAPEDRERIFIKYQQIDRGAAGVGLGLFISRGLARANGGDLWVDPETTHGSRFVLRLPAPSSLASGPGALAP